MMMPIAAIGAYRTRRGLSQRFYVTSEAPADFCVKQMVGIVVTYLVAHSLIAHKEFRFVLPLLPFFCILSGIALANR
jgi:hypothetical protein